SFRARLSLKPAEIAVTPLEASGGTAHWPQSTTAQPQATTLPSLRIARPWYGPAAIATTPLVAASGTAHCPASRPLPQPHATTRPSLVSARLTKSPAAIALTPLPAAAGTAHSPKSLDAQPQARTAPCGRSAAAGSGATRHATTAR